MRKLILFASLFLLVSQAYGAVTVGQFIDRIATKRDVSSLKFDRNTVLTEGLMIKISAAIGINATTEMPDKVVTEKQVDTYFDAFNYELDSSEGGNNSPPGNSPPGNSPPGNSPPGNSPPGNSPPDRGNRSPSDPDGGH